MHGRPGRQEGEVEKEEEAEEDAEEVEVNVTYHSMQYPIEFFSDGSGTQMAGSRQGLHLRSPRMAHSNAFGEI